MKIGIIAMSAKPVTSGHVGLIKIAARECDEVQLFVSLNDRNRKNEVQVKGSDMEWIWGMLKPALPKNVVVNFVKGSTPVTHAYAFLGKANEKDSDDEHIIYSDKNDIVKNFSNDALEKYLNKLVQRGKLALEPVSRSETVDVSGTMMRKWLATGDKENFVDHLPDALKDRGEEIWNTMQMSIALNSNKPSSKKRKR